MIVSFFSLPDIIARGTQPLQLWEEMSLEPFMSFPASFLR